MESDWSNAKDRVAPHERNYPGRRLAQAHATGPAAPPRAEDRGALVESGELLAAELVAPLRRGLRPAVDAGVPAGAVARDDAPARIERATARGLLAADEARFAGHDPNLRFGGPRVGPAGGGGGIPPAGHPGQPLTAPPVIPRTKYRWSAKKTSSGSAIEMNAAAPRRCQPLPSELTRLAMT